MRRPSHASATNTTTALASTHGAVSLPEDHGAAERSPVTTLARRRVLLDDSLRGLELVSRFEGAIVDVGSGGGAPGIPLAHALPDREVVLLEAERRKCEFLEQWAPPNARVVWGRAEEQELDWAGVAVAKALAQALRGLVVAANQDSGNIVEFDIDAASGRLKPTGEVVRTAAAVCLLFMETQD